MSVLRNEKTRRVALMGLLFALSVVLSFLEGTLTPLLGLPPGVKLVNRDRRDTDCGRYQILVGKIIDQKAFDRYWDKAQHDRRRVMEQEHWAKYARQKKRGASSPYLARNGV